MIELSSEQKIILEKIIDWRNCSKPTEGVGKKVLTVGGFAGTGKTTLIAELRKILGINIRVAFVTFTGKASATLKSKLEMQDAIFSYDYIGTIHGLIYKPLIKIHPITGSKVVCGWTRIDFVSYDLIIIDESSMVSSEIFNDLLYYNIPILAVGDHGQLPPVGDGSFNLMRNPELKLVSIHRQAEDSDIIRVSKIARERGFIPSGVYSKNVFKMHWDQPKCKDLFMGIKHDENVIVLCGMNRTRLGINKLIREKLQLTRPEPYPTERLVCLKNNRETKIMNGQLGTLIWLTYAEKDIYDITVQMDGFPDLYSGYTIKECFNKESYNDIFELTCMRKNKDFMKKNKISCIDAFDFGYAISVHRSQGSEWDKVVIFEERSNYWDNDFYKKWLYTAVTRAKEKLFIIEP
jgi:exodeoxyribonuclease-5